MSSSEGRAAGAGDDDAILKFEAESVEEALELAAERLQAERKNVRYRIIQRPSSGLLGIGAKPAVIEAWKHDPAEKLLHSVLHSVSDMDGHFLIEIDGHELMLNFYPPLGSGRRVHPAEVIAAAREYRPDRLNEPLIRDLVSANQPASAAIGHIENVGERDASFSFEISPDNMRLAVTLLPPQRGGRALRIEDVEEALAKTGVTHGLELAVLRRAIEDGIYGRSIVVATGTPPKDPTPGRVEFLFRTNRHMINFREDSFGRVDFRQLDVIENVRAGDLLARRHAPIPGVPGTDVHGREIPPARGREASLPEGENIDRTEDEIRAGIDGHVVLQDGRIVVSPVFHVKGDVNFETGNIDFGGTVRIDGLVEDGFSVRGQGSLFVKQSIGKCSVDVSGNLVVIGGILGRHEADIRAGGDLVALFIEHSKVRVGGSMTVGELILHSEVVVAGDLAMSGTRGALIGGTTIVGGNLLVRTVGGEGASRTIVRVGVPPDVYLAIREKESEIRAEDERLVKLREALNTLDRAGAAKNDAMRPQIEKLRAAKEQLESRIQFLRSAIRDLDARIEAGGTSFVHVLDVALPGTRIEIGSAGITLNAPISYATFRRVGNQVKFAPYNAS